MYNSTMQQEIIADRNICGGKACIKGTRIRVIDIVERYKILKERAEEIAAAFDIPIEKVFAALSYYYQHTSKIKLEIEKDKEIIKRMRSEMKSVVYAT